MSDSPWWACPSRRFCGFLLSQKIHQRGEIRSGYDWAASPLIDLAYPSHPPAGRGALRAFQLAVQPAKGFLLHEDVHLVGNIVKPGIEFLWMSQCLIYTLDFLHCGFHSFQCEKPVLRAVLDEKGGAGSGKSGHIGVVQVRMQAEGIEKAGTR
jgi:hypothetical protein